MRTEADVRSEVMRAVFDDQDRSVEGAIERAVRAGIEFERDRFAQILMLDIPPAVAKAAITMALFGCSADQVQGLIDLHTNLTADEAQVRRQTFKIVGSDAHDGEAASQ